MELQESQVNRNREKVLFWTKRVVPIILGAGGGYLYYFYIGCLGDSCPITSNPWTSTGYGAMIGALLVPWKRKLFKADSPGKENTSGKS